MIHVTLTPEDILRKEALNSLTKFQEWICRIFKIIPLINYRFIIRVKPIHIFYYVEGDIFSSHQGRWVCTRKENGYIILETVNPFLNISMNFCLRLDARSFKEKSHENKDN